MTVEVLYLEGCPGYAAVLSRLRELVDKTRSGTAVTVRAIPDQESALRERFLGSPTVRVDGRDVEPGAEHRADFGLKCRLYPSPGGLAPTPPENLLLDALRPAPARRISNAP